MAHGNSHGPRKVITQSFQDMPPKDGYPMAPYSRGLRPRGPSGLLIFSAIIGCSLFGLYRLGQYNEQKRINRKVNREVRMAVFPYLTAESDRYSIYRAELAINKEKEIMKNVEDWEVNKSKFSTGYSKPALY